MPGIWRGRKNYDIKKVVKKKFLNELNKNFDDRIFFVGLQGSYGRGEATEKSDIDLVVILDELTAESLRNFQTLSGLPVTGELDKITWKYLALQYPLAATLLLQNPG